MIRHIFTAYLLAITIVFGLVLAAPRTTSYYWTPRNLSCEYYGGTNTRCALRLMGESIDRNPGCFEELDEKANVTRVYCGLGCEESDETTLVKKSPQWNHQCNMFYNYNLERRRDDWFLWRSGKCVNTTIQFEVSCGTQSDPRAFYFNNLHLFEYEDAQ